MQKTAFWCFLGFGVFTVLIAFGGGIWALFRTGVVGSALLGFLLLFLGACLAVMLGSLFYIQKKEKSSSKKEVSL